MVKTIKLQFDSEQLALDYIELNPDVGTKPRDVVMLGDKCVDIEGEYDADGNVIKEPVYLDGYWIMIGSQCDEEIDQHSATLNQLRQPKAKFSGT
jgi:hypothetical protein